jgi:hypothetical protein
VLCYSLQIVVHISNEVPPSFTWHVFQTIIDILSLVVIVQCVLNKFKGHWLLSDALNFIITMSYKVKEIGIVMDG